MAPQHACGRGRRRDPGAFGGRPDRRGFAVGAEPAVCPRHGPVLWASRLGPGRTLARTWSIPRRARAASPHRAGGHRHRRGDCRAAPDRDGRVTSRVGSCHRRWPHQRALVWASRVALPAPRTGGRACAGLRVRRLRGRGSARGVPRSGRRRRRGHERLPLAPGGRLRRRRRPGQQRGRRRDRGSACLLRTAPGPAAADCRGRAPRRAPSAAQLASASPSCEQGAGSGLGAAASTAAAPRRSSAGGEGEGKGQGSAQELPSGTGTRRSGCGSCCAGARPSRGSSASPAVASHAAFQPELAGREQLRQSAPWGRPAAASSPVRRRRQVCQEPAATGFPQDRPNPPHGRWPSAS